MSNFKQSLSLPSRKQRAMRLMRADLVQWNKKVKASPHYSGIYFVLADILTALP